MNSTDAFVQLCDPWHEHRTEFFYFLDKHLDKAPTLHDNASILSALENDEVCLWRVFDGKSETKAFLLTRVHENNTYRVGTIDLAVGHDLDSWINVAEYFKNYFKSVGCNLYEIEGRRGWVKLLKPYGLNEVSVTLRMEL